MSSSSYANNFLADMHVAPRSRSLVVLNALGILVLLGIPVQCKLDFPMSWYDHQRAVQLCVLTLSAAVLPFASFQRAFSMMKALVAFVLALFIMLATYETPNRFILIESLSTALLVISATWWAGLIRDNQLGDAILLAVQLSVAFYVITLMMWFAATVPNGLTPNPFTFFDGFVNPRFFGAWVTLTWPLLLLMPACCKGCSAAVRLSLSISLFALAALWWSLAIFSGSRAVWLAAAVTILVVATRGGPARRIAARGTAVIVVGLVLHQLIFIQLAGWMTGIEPVDALDRLRTSVGLSQRDILWTIAWQGIIERPWFGAGPMMYSASNNSVASTTHNIVLQLAYEWGVPATLLVVGLVVRALWRQYLRCRSESDSFRLVLWMSIVGALVEAQFDGILSAPHSQLLFTLMVACMLSLDEPARPVLSGAMVRIWPAARFLPLVMAIGLWCAIWPEFSRLEAWEEEVWEHVGVGRYQPRFWFQGLILQGP